MIVEITKVIEKMLKPNDYEKLETEHESIMSSYDEIIAQHYDVFLSVEELDALTNLQADYALFKIDNY